MCVHGVTEFYSFSHKTRNDGFNMQFRVQNNEQFGAEDTVDLMLESMQTD